MWVLSEGVQGECQSPKAHQRTPPASSRPGYVWIVSWNRVIFSDTSSVQRPVLSKNVLRTYSIGSNQPSGGGTALTSQQSQVSSVPQQNKTNLLSAKSNVVHGGVSRSPVSPGGMMSPNLPPAPSVSVQSSGQRQIAIGGQSNVQQRTYLQTRTYAHSQPQTQNQPIYTLQQIQQQSSGPDNTPQSLDIQIPQGQTSSSPRNYGSSPVTVVLQVLRPRDLRSIFFPVPSATVLHGCSRSTTRHLRTLSTKFSNNKCSSKDLHFSTVLWTLSELRSTSPSAQGIRIRSK